MYGGEVRHRASGPATRRDTSRASPSTTSAFSAQKASHDIEPFLQQLYTYSTPAHPLGNDQRRPIAGGGIHYRITDSRNSSRTSATSSSRKCTSSSAPAGRSHARSAFANRNRGNPLPSSRGLRPGRRRSTRKSERWWVAGFVGSLGAWSCGGSGSDVGRVFGVGVPGRGDPLDPSVRADAGLPVGVLF